MTEVLKTVLILSLSGSALGLVLMLARRTVGKRLPSTLWYYAWLPVLLRLVLPLPGLIPQAQEPQSVFAAPVTAQEEPGEVRGYRQDDAGAVSVRYTETETDAGAVSFADTEETEADIGAEEAPAVRHTAGLQGLLKSPGLWLAVWLGGAAICFALYTAGYFRFRRTLMRTLQTTDGQTARVYASMRPERGPKLFRSPYVKTPMLLGLVRPLIILPDCDFTPESARNVLRHELTHYRRGDLYVKWSFAAAASLHWFNPLMPLFRRELDRVCELSCDENVLTRMDPSDRRSYGETLLDLAANRALPAGVVATTFATEKRALKERIEHIMKFKYQPRAVIALTIAALLLMGIAALAAAPARTAAGSSDEAAALQDQAVAAVATDRVEVSTVDELLAAIRPGTTAVLAPSTYDLSTASNYGEASESDYYHWEEVFDGYELVIDHVENFCLTMGPGSTDGSEVVISAVPRYADVLAFRNCSGISLVGLVVGHTVEQGQCAGGVIHLTDTDNAAISGCSLYGCGVLGVDAENCRDITVSNTDIYECSYGAVELTSCRSVIFDTCGFRDCFNRYAEDGHGSVFSLFSITSCYGVAFQNSHVYGNYAMELVKSDYSKEVYLLSTVFEDNHIYDEYDWYAGAVFSVAGDPVIVAGCEFRDDFALFSGETDPAVDMDGNMLTYSDLADMKLSEVEFPGFAEMETAEIEKTVGEDGLYEVHVSNVDEFLAAIASDTRIFLDEGLYDLSTSANYGAYGGQYYYWIDTFDGPGLVITGVDNFSIVGAGQDASRIESLPRYAAVIEFDDCRNVSVSGLTAGHTLGAGMCMGAVLEYRYCEHIVVESCGLFGCGTYGVLASNCEDIAVTDNEIYECSFGAVGLDLCAGAVFEQNDIHDCAYPTYQICDSLCVTIDSESVAEQAVSQDYAEWLQDMYVGSAVLDEIIDRGRSTGDTGIDIPGAGPYKSAAAQG